MPRGKEVASRPLPLPRLTTGIQFTAKDRAQNWMRGPNTAARELFKSLEHATKRDPQVCHVVPRAAGR